MYVRSVCLLVEVMAAGIDRHPQRNVTSSTGPVVMVPMDHYLRIARHGESSLASMGQLRLRCCPKRKDSQLTYCI